MRRGKKKERETGYNRKDYFRARKEKIRMEEQTAIENAFPMETMRQQIVITALIIGSYLIRRIRSWVPGQLHRCTLVCDLINVLRA